MKPIDHNPDMPRIAHDQMPRAMHPTEIGRRLAALREAHGMSKTDVCRALRIDNSAYTKYEAGARGLPIHTAFALASYFGVDLNFLLAGDAARVPLELARRLGIAK